MTAALLTLIENAVASLAADGLLPEAPAPGTVGLERTGDPRHGHFTTPVALRLAKAAGLEPRGLAQAIVAALPPNALIARTEIAGSGFINVFLSPGAYAEELARIHAQGRGYGTGTQGQGERVLLRPAAVDVALSMDIDVSQARAAAYAAALEQLLQAVGYRVTRESALPEGAPEQGFSRRIEVRPIDVRQAGHHAALDPLEGWEVQRIAPMRVLRAGEPLPLAHWRPQLEQAGEDACRFFYLMRSHEEGADLDVALAQVRTPGNPAFCVPYAHARGASALNELGARGFHHDPDAGLAHLALLTASAEQALLASVTGYGPALQQAAARCAPHRLVRYLRELAHALHTYHREVKWIVPQEPLRHARLVLVLSAQQVIRNGLELLGLSAPDSM